MKEDKVTSEKIVFIKSLKRDAFTVSLSLTSIYFTLKNRIQ